MRHSRAVRKCAVGETGKAIVEVDHVETVEKELLKVFELW